LSSTTRKQTPLLAYLALVTGIFSIGLSPLLLKWANAPGVVSSFYRMGFGAALMLVPFGFQILSKRIKLPRRGVMFAIAGGFFFSIDMFLWSTGVMISDPAIPTLLANTAPLWVGLGSLIVFKESLSHRFWIGLVTALVGAGLVLSINMNKAPEFGLGALYGLLAAIFYGAFYLASQRGREHLDTLSYFWISTTAASIFLLIYSLILREPILRYNNKTWLLFFIMGLLVQVLGWMFINYAQGHLSAAVVSPTMLAQPLLVAILAWLLLSQRFTAGQLIGGFLIIGGVLLVHYSNGKS